MKYFIEKDNALQATFKFKDFQEAWGFMTQVAIYAEKTDHHPNWSNVWNTVEFKITTHDAGNTVTEKDLKLAEYVESVYKKYCC